MAPMTSARRSKNYAFAGNTDRQNRSRNLALQKGQSSAERQSFEFTGLFSM